MILEFGFYDASPAIGCLAIFVIVCIRRFFCFELFLSLPYMT